MILEMKLGSSLACCLSSLQTETRWTFWSSLSSLGTNLAEMRFMFKLSTKMRWTHPYDSPTLSQTVDSLPTIWNYSRRLPVAFGGFLQQFFTIETKFVADSLLLNIRHFSCKKSPNITSQKRTERNNTSSQLGKCWHTDSQSILLATSSGGRAYDNRFGRAV